MAEAVSADQLPVKFGQEYRVKLGKSFTFPKENAYHTIKYDFKPLSVDPTKPGKLRVVEDEVNVQLPLVQAELTDDMAQFRGPRKPVAKECVLIIDTVSGEAVLERISNSIPLKAIRDGRKSVNPRDRSVSPAPIPSQPKTAPITKPTSTATPSPASSSTKKRPLKSKTPKASLKQEPAQSQINPQGTLESGSAKKVSRKSIKKAAAVKTESPLVPQIAASSVSHTSNMMNVGPSMPVFNAPGSETSMPSLGSGLSMPDPSVLMTTLSKKLKVEQGNPSSSSDSSSSDSSDSEAEDNEPTKQAQFSNSPLPPLAPSGHMPPLAGHVTLPGSHMTQQGGQPSQQGGVGLHGHGGGHMTQSGQVIGHLPQQRPPSTSSSSSDSSDSSSGSSSSDSSDSSDQENDREVASAFTHQQQNNARQRTMSQLRTDLQLSDSGSDSDS